ncbi:MAG: TonB-dependent receptor [Saprospiraceae bacterium]|nr:TonB-dependent receptor [Saprospiraceae bacterium]
MKNQIRAACAAVFLIFSGSASYLAAQPAVPELEWPEQAQDTAKALIYNIPEVKVLGEKPRLMGDIPGSAAFISPASLKTINPINGNEALRTVAGLHVVEEEGIGMRVNIGIRGLDPDRSSRVLILEDGVPVALNPFGEPQMYYSPAIDRMEAVEVLKGSGQILFGPQTIGGVINYITAAPPASEEGRIRITAGQNGFFSSLLSYGNTVGNAGFRVDYLRKQADNIGSTQFRINDLTGKVLLRQSARATLGLKWGVYDEVSNSTYIGLTQAMYDQGGQDFVQLAPDDLLKVRRFSGSVSHEYRFTPLIRVKTTAFGYTTERNWQRQDFGRTPATSNLTGVVWGDESIPGGAIYMRNQNGHRDRQFEVAGIEPRLTAHFDVGKISNKLETGARYLFERAYEQRVNGRKAGAASGALVEDEIRSGQALSAYFQNRMEFNRRMSFSFGLRAESYFYERDIARIASTDTSIVSNTQIFQWIPGIGLQYNATENWTFFTGIHRGFAPPRVKDAIANSGEVYNLDPELSWNSELGLRGTIGKTFFVEWTAFHTDFSNQIIPISESSGGSGSGLVNGGRSLHRGVEMAANWNAGAFFLPQNHTLELYAALTYVDARYNVDRFINEGDAVNINGNRTPYAPDWLYSAALQYAAPFGLQARFTLNGQSAQFTDELNTETPSANGETGRIDARFTLDGSLSYALPGGKWSFQAGVKNLTDERFIATRRPQGIRVNVPRFLSAGVEWRF